MKNPLILFLLAGLVTYPVLAQNRKNKNNSSRTLIIQGPSTDIGLTNKLMNTMPTDQIENSLEVSALHHNVLSGFLGLRIGLRSIGEGNLRFKNFVYKPIK